MRVKIVPSCLSGTLPAISSKSAVHRLCIAASLARARSAIVVRGISDDIRATLCALSSLGTKIAIVPDRAGQVRLELMPGPIGREPVLDCGECGSTARFLLPVAAAVTDAFTLTGRGSLLPRPFEPLCRVMERHGVQFDRYQLPIRANGMLTPGRFAITGAVSSQYITGLLFALPLLPQDSEIVLTCPLESAGYVDLTLSILERFGVSPKPTEWGYSIQGSAHYCAPEQALAAEGDWSNAASLLCAAAIDGGVTVTGLSLTSRQRDRAILPVLSAMGARVIETADSVSVESAVLKSAGTIDAREIPDLVPVIAAVSALAEGETVITGAARLRFKESDRLHSVAMSLGAIGADIVESGDELIIRGKPRLSGGVSSAYNDHRIVMALAVAALGCAAPVVIDGVQAVEKSYPRFFEDFRCLGGKADVL